MGCLYFINDGMRGYIGRDSLHTLVPGIKNNSLWGSRLADHIRLSYGYKTVHFDPDTGKDFKENNALKQLIGSSSISQLNVSYITDSNYGIPEDVLNEIWSKWTWTGSTDPNLALAELLYVWLYRNTFAQFNKSTGGYGQFSFDIVKAVNNPKSPLYLIAQNNIIIKNALLKRQTFKWRPNYGNRLEEKEWAETFFFPERLILNEVFLEEIAIDVLNDEDQVARTIYQMLLNARFTKTHLRYESKANALTGVVTLNMSLNKTAIIQSWKMEIDRRVQQWNKTLPPSYQITVEAMDLDALYESYVRLAEKIWDAAFSSTKHQQNRKKTMSWQIETIKKKIQGKVNTKNFIQNVTRAVWHLKPLHQLYPTWFNTTTLAIPSNYADGQNISKWIVIKMMDEISRETATSAGMKSYLPNAEFLLNRWYQFYDPMIEQILKPLGGILVLSFPDEPNIHTQIGLAFTREKWLPGLIGHMSEEEWQENKVNITAGLWIY